LLLRGLREFGFSLQYWNIFSFPSTLQLLRKINKVIAPRHDTVKTTMNMVFIGPCASREGPCIVLSKRHMVKMSRSYLTPFTPVKPKKTRALNIYRYLVSQPLTWNSSWFSILDNIQGASWTLPRTHTLCSNNYNCSVWND
jgi:hypothetical protein